MTSYLFDVDGTLTNPREPINPEFAKFFGEWVVELQSIGDEVFLVTGSDRTKTIQQIGKPLYRLMDGVYQNCGNQLFVRNSLIYESKWAISAHLRLDLLILAERSPWFGKAEQNIEERVGMANFSTIGRSATNEQRKAYALWDEATKERKKNADWLSRRYPKLEFDIGGQISTDIYPKGRDKSQVLKYMKDDTIFFGDKCQEGGNDHTISRQAKKYHQVEGWKETMFVIGSYYG
jgi:phosphomannomutase